MKTKDIFLAIAAALTFAMVLYACKNPGEDVTIHINTDVLKSPMAVQFVNAVKGASNQPDDFPVTIAGKDADKVVTINNKTDFKATDGRIFLALKKGVVATAAAPIIFTVAAEVPGFTPATKTFRITGDEPNAVVVPLVEYANPAPGTTAKVQQNPLNGGINASAIVIETPATSGMAERASITIAAGTRFLDAAGNPINASTLESRIVQYGTESLESLEAFPGGFNAINVIGENGQPIEGGIAFVTAGFIAIDLYAGGTEVKSFSQPLQVRMDINKNVQNPMTGALVKAGDVVPVWSLDDKIGQWKFEANATVSADAQGNLSAGFAASHLSYWNFDWGIQYCNNQFKLSLKAQDAAPASYIVTVQAENGYHTSATVSISNGQADLFQRLPNTRLKFVVYNTSYNKLAETDYIDACAAGQAELNIPAGAAVDLVNVNIKLQGTCPNKPVNENITTWVLLREKNSPVGIPAHALNGRLNLRLKNNTEYVIDAQYGDSYKTANILFSKTNFTFPGTVSGTATYNQANNTLDVAASFKLPNCN